MSEEKYPLDQLVMIKKKRLEEAEKLLKEKKEILLNEEEKLSILEKKRDEVKTHYQEKLKQLREKLDAGEGAIKITQMKQYLKLVSEQLAAEEVKVNAQLKVVETARDNVEKARQDVFKKQKDVEKLKMHHQEWTKEVYKQEEHREGVEADEMGNTMYNSKKLEKKRRTHE
jgi:flagellar biosynthesis chaperone FliJ